jgi:hypothetical protein
MHFEGDHRLLDYAWVAGCKIGVSRGEMDKLSSSWEDTSIVVYENETRKKILVMKICK